MDCLNLTPEPDFLVLADECQDYYYQMPLTEVNPDENEPGQTNGNVLASRTTGFILVQEDDDLAFAVGVPLY